MQNRCYHCKFLLNDGIPPLEALSVQQMTEVGGDESNFTLRRFHMLEGTPYEGLSIYNFCAFCTKAIMDYPSAVFGDHGNHKIIRCDDRENYRWMGRDCESCGPIYRAYKEDDASWRRFDETLAARSCTLHHIEVIYKNADMKDMKALMEMEA